ncbi:hypothetical protein JVU11DRAFT_7896 [Chiua virens]|nr:hypothetical protein JVU11DRAFT_7896 [Chiua virens]
MPPKRRGAQTKSAAPPKVAATPDQPKSLPSSKSAPTPPPALAPPPPKPIEVDATRVRKEWSRFMDAWYEPQKKKFVEKLQKDLLVKYKDLGPAKETQKLREMELFEKLDSIAQQLAQPAREEWERRLYLAQLREDQWDNMSGEEQQEVMSVFVGFFADDVEDMDADLSADPSSIEDDESIVEEPQYRSIPSTSFAPSRHPVPPTPSRGTFEFVNPTSLFTPSMTPPNPSKNLPALSMDHLATLDPSNAGRSADPASASVNAMFGFQNWASEAGIVTQQPQGQPAKPPSVPSSAQTLSARPRATDNMSRQASAASNLSSPPLKSSSPQYSPPNHTTKFSPPINAENLPPGKRYIGPTITEDEPDPMDEELLKSKMADDYQQYKISLRIQMIYQFHAEAADIEIKLFETLLADEGTKESRARAVQEHETSMMHLREQKEEERKRLCAEEREKRRQEMRQHLAHRRSVPTREVDHVPARADPQWPMPDKTSFQPQRPGKATHQKENVPVSLPVVATPSAKLEPPSIMKKSISTLSQDEASANEAVFANAMATMSGNPGATGLTAEQASLNEALFANAKAMLASQGQQPSGKNTLQPPSIMKKSHSSRSHEHDVPQITVSFAEPPRPVVAPEPAQLPPTTTRGKKGKKAQPAVQLPPTKSVTITEELDIEAEPPPPAASLWDAATVATKSARGTASVLSASKAKVNVSIEDDDDDVHAFPTVLTPGPSKSNAATKKTPQATKKGKKVTITEEPDGDADPIVSPTSSKLKAAKGGWGPANGKSKVVPTVVEESEPEPLAAPPPGPRVASAWGKKTSPAANSKASAKPQLKATVSEEPESESEPEFARAPPRTNKGKSAWGAPPTTSSTGATTKAGKKTAPQQEEPRRGVATPGLKSARVEVVPDPEDEWVVGDGAMPGTLEFVASEEAEEYEEEVDTSGWFKPENMSYWANFIAGQPEPEAESPSPVSPAAESAEPVDKHVRWTPTAGGESDDEEELGEGDAELANNVWMQYAISGGDTPSFGDIGEPHFTTSESVQHETMATTTASVWEQGKGKKPHSKNPHSKNPTTGDLGNRVQQTPVFDRAAFTGQQWPKMESWLSPPARGQNSGSARVF